MVKYKECRVVKPKTEALGFRIGVILRDKKYEKAWSLNPIWGGGVQVIFLLTKNSLPLVFRVPCIFFPSQRNLLINFLVETLPTNLQGTSKVQ